MDFDELDRTVETLTRDRDQLRQDVERLRREFDQLNSKLRYPGTKLLVDLEYQLLYDSTTTVVTLGSTNTLIETLPSLLHAVYQLSAYCTDSTSPYVVCDGGLVGSPGLTIGVYLARVQVPGPPKAIEVRLIVSNPTAANRTIAVRVWRRLGMGSSTT
jgi:hypothetical protein